ncbi:acyl-CoA--6-aminopenicillanic acid acyltransferase [Leptospira kobayashii]|uniref:Acyl-CoA--6-aminopenicillanic acid acyltransferase n=1 Tax=Leptospira kobayashii TaxID=1917830 RepID=A0ABM7UH81_9LEPT|nr:carcinine hydrolase/isopenicillin-N N-acyltransferase family protein [Leptospira kobayashii]BDA78023.1 acyl-CoA--6-aminopenicillanic acid acyltransferase [Leptospira kobayashii]
MCDTSLATELFTGTEKRIFAKNSDREPNEAQLILHIPKQNHKKGSSVQCTFISIPQTEITNEVFLSKPFQMWGAEMGVNEYGLAIGNEAVFTKLKIKKKNDGLTGMDLLRLALERCKTAKEALILITELLEKHGQDACGGYENKSFFYHNSFIIADRSDGFVLETADRLWAAKPIDKFYAISNGLTIESDYTMSSKNLENEAIKAGYWKKGKDFSFNEAFSDWFFTKMGQCENRRQLHETNATASYKTKGIYTAKSAMEVLRSHTVSDSEFEVSSADMGSLCLHAGGLLTPNQTNGSMIVEWNTSAKSNDPLRIWYTGTSTPCLSVFKPFFFGTSTFIDHSPLNPKILDDTSLWIKHEQIARRANFDYQTVRAIVVPETRPMESQLVSYTNESLTESKKNEMQIKALKDHTQLIQRCEEELKQKKIGKSKWTSPLFQTYWQKQNGKLKIKL